MVRASDARKLVEKVRAERLEEEQRRMDSQAKSRALSAQAQRVYDEAFEAERRRMQIQQAEDIKKVEGHHNIAHYTFNGSDDFTGLPLGPQYLQRCYAAAEEARNKWQEKHA
jgi:hypothetical protein